MSALSIFPAAQQAIEQRKAERPSAVMVAKREKLTALHSDGAFAAMLRRQRAMVNDTAPVYRLKRTECRWPLWSGDCSLDDMKFCCDDAEPGRPYCRRHYERSVGRAP